MKIDLSNMEITKIERIQNREKTGYQIFLENEYQSVVLEIPISYIDIDVMTLKKETYSTGSIDLKINAFASEEGELFTLQILRNSMTISEAEEKLEELLGYKTEILGE